MTKQGKLVTDATYADYKDYDGISFPSRIEIFRPQEEYDITLNMLKLEMNQPLRDDQFVLEQPPGAEVVHLDAAAAVERGGAAGGEIELALALSSRAKRETLVLSEANGNATARSFGSLGMTGASC